MPPKKNTFGRLPKAMNDAREKFVLEYFRKHPNNTKDELNAALRAVAELGSMPMRPVRIYELKRAAADGAKVPPPAVAGKRPSQARSAQGAHRGGTLVPSEELAVQQAKHVLAQAGLEEVEISYRPPKRTVSG